MSDHEKKAKEQKRQDRVRETKVIRDTQAKIARDHYKLVKNRKSASPWHRNKHNRKDGQ